MEVYMLEMSSSYRAGNLNSAGSSPRRAKCKQVLSISSPIGSRDPQAALHSSWIQRIIPLSRPFEQAVEDEQLLLEAKEGKMQLFHPMDTDDEEDVEDQDYSGKIKLKKTDERSSWLTVHEEKPLCLPGMEPSTKHDTFRGNSRDNSLDSRIVHVRRREYPEAGPVKYSEEPKLTVRYSEDPKLAKVVPVTEDSHLESIERCKEGTGTYTSRLDSSAWFTRIAKKDEDGLTATNHTVKPSFPPLKSGEQWPGTLKPSNLPPLRIPSNRSLQEDKELRLEQKPRASDEEMPSLMRTISLFDSKGEQRQASASSDTCSLPSAFIAEVYQKGRDVSDGGATSSMRFMPRQISKHNKYDSCSSETKSLLKDCVFANGEDEASSQEVDSCLNMKENRFSGTTPNMTEASMLKSKKDQVLLQSQSAKHDDNKRLEVRLFSAADEAKQNAYMPNSSLVRKEHILNGGGSQQWLQRWCSANSNISRHQKP